MTNWWQFTSDWDSCNINDVGLYAAVLSNLQVSNTTIAAGTDKCFNAAQTITVAGDGTTVKVEGGGTATFISGQKVLLKPVTKVLSGGYLHAYITTTSAYCGSAFKPLVENPENSADDPQPADQNLKINRIRIYPNPASDFIMIEFDQTKTPAEVFVSIYNMSGKPVHQQWMRGEGIRQLPLTGVPAGIYLVQVQSEGQPEIVKVMKY